MTQTAKKGTLCASKCKMERKMGMIAFPIISVGFIASIWHYWL